MIYCPKLGSGQLTGPWGTILTLPQCPAPGCKYPSCPNIADGPYKSDIAIHELADIFRHFVKTGQLNVLTFGSTSSNIVVASEKASKQKQEQPEIAPKLEEVKMVTVNETVEGVPTAPEQASPTISPKSLDMGFIGVGGGGCKIVDAFASYGYESMVINTTDRDYAHLTNIPQDDNSRIQLYASAGGAGKDPDVGASAVNQYANEILKKIQIKMGNKEFVFVCFGLGGGTGSIGGTLVAQIAAMTKVPVGVIVTLPRLNEGTDEKVNCLKGLQEIANCKGINAIVVVDNQKISKNLSNVTDQNFWSVANQEIVSLFHRFNTLSSMPSNSAFDPEDYKKCLKTPGFLVLGRTAIPQKAFVESVNGELIGKLHDSIQNGFLADGFDTKSSIRVAGLVTKPFPFDYGHGFEEQLFDYLKSQMGAGSLNRGIYTLEQPCAPEVEILTMFSGMKLPEARVKQLFDETKNEASQMAAKVNERLTETVDLGLAQLSDLNKISGTPTTKPQTSLNTSALKRRG
jgi:cell division GTPase FtsZ